MVILTKEDFNDHLKTNVEPIKEITGHQMDDYNFLWFGRYAEDISWSWYLITFDNPIVDGEVTAYKNTARRVNPDGFIFNDEIYKIEVDAYA